MAGPTVDELSVEELERLILVRRREARLAAWRGKTLKPGRKRRRLAAWEKLLRAVELVVILALVITFLISGRGWVAIRERFPLPTDGVTFVQPALSTAAPAPAAIGAARGDVAARAFPLASVREVPAHLAGWIDPAPAQPVPSPAAVSPTRILIPSIGVDAPVGEGTDWDSLKYRVGHHPGTANPGQRGNMVLAAHNDVYGELFRYLPDVPVGETVTVYAGEQVYRYLITERRMILPNETEVMLPTTGPTLTLISCYPYLIDTHRIVLFGELMG